MPFQRASGFLDWLSGWWVGKCTLGSDLAFYGSQKAQEGRARKGRGFYTLGMANPAPDLAHDEPSIFDIEDLDAKERAIAEAEASPPEHDVPAADVLRWVASWGKPDELPPPWK